MGPLPACCWRLSSYRLMRILVTKGPNAGKVLDYSTRQAESALEGGWAVLPPAVDEIPAVPPGAVDVALGESHIYVGADSTLTVTVEPLEVEGRGAYEREAAKPARKRKGRA